MLRISIRKRKIHHHLGHDLAQPRDHPARLVKQPHMGIASRKMTAGVWESWLILDRHPQPGDCLLETSAEERSGTDQECWHFRRARAEAQGGLTMLDRQIRLAGPQPEKTADVPAARVVRIEGEGAID